MLVGEYTRPKTVAWGWKGILAWTALIAVTFVLTQIVAAIIYLVATDQVASPLQQHELARLMADGDAVAVSTWSTLVVCGLLVIVAVSAKAGANINHYLGFKSASWRAYVLAVIVIVVFGVIVELLNQVFERPIPQSMMQMYQSADNRLLFCLAIVIAAPAFEELFFRGFLLTSIEASRLGLAGAIVISSALWAIIHLQYDTYEVGIIFVMGIVLGLARQVTGSLYVPIVMHALNNLISTVQIYYSLAPT